MCTSALPVCLGVGATGHQVDEVRVVVDAGPLPEALRRLHGERVELEVDAQQLGHRPVDRLVVEVEPEEARPRQGGQHVLRRGRLVTAVAAQGPLQHAPSLTSARAAAVGWGPGAGLSRSGRDRRRPGSGASSGGSADPGHGVGQHPGRVGALQQAVGAVAGGHPDVAPARQGARPGRGRPPRWGAARPGSRGRPPRRARAPRAGTHAAARAGRRP